VSFFCAHPGYTLWDVRILQISSAKTFGGGERHLVDLCRELHLRGHEIFVALRPTNEWQERLDFLPPGRILHVSIRNSFGMFSAKRIARFIGKHGIQIVHAHVARDYLTASIASRSADGSKMVLTRHVMFPMKPFHRFALRNVTAAVAVSPPVREQLLKIFPSEKVRLIANGIAMTEGRASRAAEGKAFRELHDIPNEVPLIATLGELKPLKGQRDFVLAANQVIKRHPDSRFVIAGTDNSLDQRFRRELKRLVRVLGHEDRFLWLDWLDDVHPLLAAADIFVSPSHTESFGLAILDAMAAGTPIVATETDGAKELMISTNALVGIKDPLALAETICRLIEDDEARKTLGSQLERSARERFSLASMIDATERLYDEILLEEPTP
jgi:glycosyltransferase involved in cell wall biosynthesis